VIEGLPEGYTARGLEPAEDIAAILSLTAAADLVDAGFEDSIRSIIEEDWRSPRFDPARDALVVLAADGSVVAEGECSGRPGAEVEAYARVHPVHRGRGIGAHFMDWSERRASDHVAAGAKPILRNSIPAEDPAAASLLRDRGYRRATVFQHLELSLRDLDPLPPVPDGVEIRPARVPEDLTAIHDAMEEAFSAHFGFAPVPFEEWRAEWMDAPEVDPGLFLVAWVGADLAGAALSMNAGPVGWVGDVGVRPAFRGRGIGEALMHATFATLAERGFADARLNVDAGNESGAVRLYERVGMTVRRAWHVYEKPLAEG
jgi:mycothiol synthase